MMIQTNNVAIYHNNSKMTVELTFYNDNGNEIEIKQLDGTTETLVIGETYKPTIVLGRRTYETLKDEILKESNELTIKDEELKILNRVIDKLIDGFARICK